VFKAYSTTDIASGNLEDTKKLIGTGPYTYQSGVGAASTTVVWKKRNNWWATTALGKSVGPTYVVDIKNGTNAAALSNLLAGNIDSSTTSRRRTRSRGSSRPTTRRRRITSGANTTWLFPNTTKAPLNDKQFRRALATSINMNQIIDKAYQGLVEQGEPDRPAADLEQVGRQEGRQAVRLLVQPGKAKAILAAAGYKDTNGDGYVENKDGSKIDLKIVCPNGWSDWMTAIQVIADSAKAVGIKITPAFPSTRRWSTTADTRRTTCSSATTGSTATRRGRTTSTSSSCRSRQPGRRELRALLEPDRWNLTRRWTRPRRRTRGLPGVMSKLQTDVHAGSARDPALVQRHVVDGQHEVLDELAVAHERAGTRPRPGGTTGR
jgi:hypothetical protein